MSMGNDLIGDRIMAIEESLPEGTRLVAVSKFHPIESIVSAYEAGQRRFGESRVQELMSKQAELSTAYLDLKWHFIGPLQTNKVKYIAPFIHMIESVTSEKLLEEICRQAEKNQRRIRILLEVHVAQEESKSGFSECELWELLELMHDHPETYKSIRLSGLMAMATNTDDQSIIDGEFAHVSNLFNEIKNSGILNEPELFRELSMGMSGDYPLAIKHGATLIRIGSAIFGERSYEDD